MIPRNRSPRFEIFSARWQVGPLPMERECRMIFSVGTQSTVVMYSYAASMSSVTWRGPVAVLRGQYCR